MDSFNFHRVKEKFSQCCVCALRLSFFNKQPHLLLSQQASDPIVGLLDTSTEEGKKVQRNGGKTFPAVFRRIRDTTEEQEAPGS